MVHTPHRYYPLERRGFNEEETGRSGTSPLRVHFLDYKEDNNENIVRKHETEEEKISRMTFEEEHSGSSLNLQNNHSPSLNSKNLQLSIVPPPAPRLANDLYLQFSSHLDRFDQNWRDDPFWRDLYPRWAEPIFKDGLDVRTNIFNDRNRFAVEIDAYQFRPEELEVKTLDDTLLIEGRHEDVRDPDNYTKMYFVRKYQLPPDVHPQEISSSIDGSGRLTVEARKPYAALEGRERVIPIEGSSKRIGSRSNSYSPRDTTRASFRNGGNYDGGYYRSGSRAGGEDYRLGADYRSNADYRNGEDSRFRSNFTSSNNNLAAPITTTIPVTTTRESYSRSASRQSRREFSDGPNGFYQSEIRSSSRGPGDFRSSSRGPVDFRSSSRGPDLFRSSSRGPDYYRGENLLRPEPEIGDRAASRAESARSVRVQRHEERYT